ncbi:MAG: DNA/RNA non-specific endonuclease [Anaerocolumna sp.]
MHKLQRQLRLVIFIIIILMIGYNVYQYISSNSLFKGHKESSYNLENIPEYSGSPYVSINNNVPSFDEKDKTKVSFENYSELDILDRCSVAFANIGIDLMPTEKRGSISQVKPTGWHSVQYENVDGKSLYNRCHLIGFQLTAENANEENLITGTRYLNVDGMLPFENMVADYIKETNHHVLYRVTPIFEGTNLVASGVLMEAYSVEDEGEGISFFVYVYNVQPGITIDYETGESQYAEESISGDIQTSASTENNGNTETSVNTENNGNTETNSNNGSKVDTDTTVETGEIRGNSNSMIYHCPGQNAYEPMAESKYLVVFASEEEAKEAGYRRAKR